MRLALVFLAIASFPAAAQPVPFFGQQMRMPKGPQQQPVGKGVISGNVVNEISREPMKKVQVSLNGPVSLSAVTDDAGHFAFKLLPPGPYVLQALDASLKTRRPRLRGSYRSTAMLAADEQRSGVVLMLMPAGSISGRLTDEEGLPLANCGVMAMQVEFNQGVRTLAGRNGASTNETGEYRIVDLAPGRYLVLARCHQTIPLPHAFIRRNSGVEVPTVSYTPQFYPGTPDPSAAARVLAAGGTEVSGIDFRLSPSAGISVRGKISATDPEGAAGNIQIMLESRDPLQRGLGMTGARFDRQSGEFRFDKVTPGSYEIVANNFGENRRFHARVPIEIGTTQPDPVIIMLAPAMTITGTVVQEGEATTPLESVGINLSPMEHYFAGQQPNSRVQKNGSFSLTGVVPGRWLVTFGGVPGYIKSVALNNRESTSPVVDIAEGASGSMKIVVSTAMAQLEGTVSGIPSDPAQAFGILWRAQEGLGPSEQVLPIDPQGKFTTSNLQPGKYVVCAVGVEPWVITQDRALMDAVKGRCETVDLSPSGRASVQLRFIPARDLETIQASLDN